MSLLIDRKNVSKIVTRDVIVGCIVNATMGVLYVWGLFLLPMENTFSGTRTMLSLVPAFALVSFTLGMVVHVYLLRSMPVRVFTALVFILTAGGHLLFFYSGSFTSLVVGYGLVFGFGSGLGYGLALALAGRAPEEFRSLSIGIVMASFAVSGVILSSLFAGFVAASSPVNSFGVIGLGISVVGCLVTILLGRTKLQFVPQSKSKWKVGEMLDPGFLILAFTFFVLCYAGLMVVSHSTGILQSKSIAAGSVELAPGAFTGGYIIGCLFGGKLVELLSPRVALLSAILITVCGLVILLFAATGIVLLGIAAIGAVFGSTASLMPVLIGAQYGTDRIGDVYGKLMVSYGAAGLIAPWATGYFYENFESYSVALGLSIGACLIVFLTVLARTDHKPAGSR